MKKYKYKKEYTDLLIKHMSEGLSFESFAGLIGVARSTLYDWVDTIPEFAAAKEEAWARSLLHWERVGKEGMFMGGKDNPFNATVWVFSMKNKFSWSDRVEQKVEGKMSLENLVGKSFEDGDAE